MGIWHPQLKSFSMEESYHDKHGISQFLTDLAPKETPWDTHRSNAQSVQMLYEYSKNLTSMQNELTAVQAF